MKELIENLKNLQATYQDVFNISDTLPSNDTENNWDVLLQPNNNAVQYGRKKGTTIIIGDFILPGLKESKMSQKRLIKVSTFPGATIWDVRFFVVPHLKKRTRYHSKIIIHVGTNPPLQFI